MRFGSPFSDGASASPAKLVQSLNRLRVHWARYRARYELRAIQNAMTRALRAEADAARLRNSPPRSFLQ
jgi:hypothetical protein